MSWLPHRIIQSGLCENVPIFRKYVLEYKMQRAILRDFLVDDILTGANSIDETRISQKELVETLKRGRSDLRKCTANESSIILDLPPEYREVNYNFEFLDKDHTITFGIVWQHNEN